MDFKPKQKLGFGLMRLPTLSAGNPSDVDVEQVKQMVDLFLERGFTYFDTAWMYNGFASEKVAKTALVDRYPRDSFTLSTKLHAGFFNSREERENIFNEQLRKTGAGYFDYYLLHGIERKRYPKFEELGCFSWLQEKKEAGLIRHAGFSYHDNPELLDRILTEHPEIEFVQLQVNYLDWESEWIQSRGCYETAVKHGKPVIVMEPAKGGTLSRIPEAAQKVFRDLGEGLSPSSYAIRFAASLPGVMLVLSGMSTLSQMEENTGYMRNFVPLTEGEKAACFSAAEIINSQVAVPCTACSYCTEGCPQGIPIPSFFSIYNEDMREQLDVKGWTVNYTNYSLLAEKGSPASACIECGQCESVCPQHLPIIKHLKEVAAHYEPHT